MFKHLLLPTDGSKLSEAAIRKGIELAKDNQARVTGLSVIPEFHVFTYHTEMLEDTREQYAKDSRAHAAQYLQVIERQAREAGVPCDTVTATSDHPYEAIIKTAKDSGCDLIMMASHGRKGLQATLIGSETQKVLTHCDVPVLVYR
jgi:nucleotide-binding universal stress UspA family protein